MKRTEIKTIQDLVEEILIDCRAARNSDNILEFKVYQTLLEKQGKDITQISAAMLFLNMKNYGLPGPETIRRTRQKLQADNPYLRGDADITAKRTKNEKVYKDYATS